jgi:hypothetical protein
MVGLLVTLDGKTYPPRQLVTMTSMCSLPEAGNRKEMVMLPCVRSITTSHPYFTSFILRGSYRCNCRFGAVEKLIMHKGFHCFAGKKT